jgi:hypothetical protein
MINLKICNGSYPFICTNKTTKQTDEGIRDCGRITEYCKEVGKRRTEGRRVPDQLWWTAVRSLKEAVLSPPN